MAAKTEAVKVLAERQLGERFNAISRQLNDAESSIDQLTSRNLELARDMTAAESRVRELETDAERGEELASDKGAEIARLEKQLSEAEEKNKTLEKNLESVLKSKDRARIDANKDAREAKSELREVKRQLRELEKLRIDERIDGLSERGMPRSLLIKKNIDGTFGVDLAYQEDTEEEVEE